MGKDGNAGKLKSLAELRSIRQRAAHNIAIRLTDETPDRTDAPVRMDILVCGGTGCEATESRATREALIAKIRENGLEDKVRVLPTGCFGFCEQGPIVKVYPDNVFYVGVTKDDAGEIVKEHVMNGRIVERLLYHDEQGPKAEHRHIPFYKRQLRRALRNCGVIDPENIEDYIARDGYEAFGRVLESMRPEQVIDMVKQSGLRGRGGGGFPTGVKWEATHQYESDKKFVICNADEGDPGAFMDRSILEGDPHSVLEAMAIAGYAIGADEGVIYIRAEYPLAIWRLQTAIRQAEELGLLGRGIMGFDFNFHIQLNFGAGAFVCGEETSLMNSVQGLRGEPRVKPPFPAEVGLFGKPSIINNVETFANICPIILNGPEWFGSIGTEKSKGTKVFALAGKINNVGLVEVPMGITLREIIYDIGGGIRNGKKIKAVQTGGPSGGCIPAEMLDLPIDYDSLISAGSMMGSGGMIVLDEDDCMVDFAKFYLGFTVDESCGKCTPCRIGNRRLYETMERITNGEGTQDDLDELEDLGAIIKDCSLCGLGQTAPNPILSTLKYFYHEYEEHVLNKRCPTGRCKSLMQYVVNPETCTGCTLCARNCPVPCIEGERKSPHHIIQEQCIKCGVCFSKCPVGAIEKK